MAKTREQAVSDLLASLGIQQNDAKSGYEYRPKPGETAVAVKPDVADAILSQITARLNALGSNPSDNAYAKLQQQLATMAATSEWV